MTTLSSRAMLTTLRISQWTARRLDRDETRRVNASHGLRIEAARVNKKLLPFGVELERVHQITGAIRKDFAARTLPWGIDGVSILKASAYMEFVDLVNRWQDDWHGAVEAFFDAYPTLYREAQLELGTLFNADDYPDVSDLRRRFAFSVRFMPVPDAQDWRVDVGDKERKRLEEDIRKRLIETEREAMGEAWRRLKEVLDRTHERLASPDAIFRDSLVENAVEICSVLPMLNVSDDPALEDARRSLERAIAPYVGRVDTLRHDPVARTQAASDVADIMRKMGGLYAQAA